MKVVPTPLPGVRVIEPTVFSDERGRFVETFQRERYRAHGITDELVQDNFSSSRRGVLRGLHYQLVRPQGKLVWVTLGEVFDVAVDLRRTSPTYGRWFGTMLSADTAKQLWIPAGCAHGFVVTSELAHVAYKVSAIYDAGDERSLAWDDPTLAIAWPVGTPILSPRDAAAPRLAEVAS